MWCHDASFNILGFYCPYYQFQLHGHYLRLVPVIDCGSYSTFLASLTSWDLHNNLNFTLTTSGITFSGSIYRGHIIGCLASQVLFWNMGRSFHDSITLTFCMPAKPVSCGQCQGLPPAWVLSLDLGPWPWTTRMLKWIILGIPLWQGTLMSLSSQGKVFAMYLLFQILKSAMNGVWSAPDMRQGTFPRVPRKHRCFFLMVLISSETILILDHSFLTKLQVFSLSALLFAPGYS
jgi:hypothetical protein